jgi:polar amino acid transport system substrate-binding protein
MQRRFLLKNTILFFILLSFTIVLSGKAFSFSAEKLSMTENNKVINVAAEVFPPMTNADGTGQQFEMLKAIFEPLGYTFNITLYPYRRMLYVVETAQVDMAIGIAKFDNDNILFSSLPHDADNIVAIYPKSNKFIWRGKASLENKKLSFIAGLTSALSQSFSELNYAISEVDTREQALKKLLLGRVDFLIDCECGYLLAEVTPYRKQFQAHKIGFLEIYAGFANTEKAKQLKLIWQQSYPRFIQTDQARNIYQKWGLAREYSIISKLLQEKSSK